MENLKLILNLQNNTTYKTNNFQIEKEIVETLLKYQIFGKVELGLQLVGKTKIRQLNYKYRKIDQVTDVLSFPQITNKQIPIINLGDIVICYSEALKDCQLKSNYKKLKLKDQKEKIDKVIIKLTKHGLKHLLGIHHK